MEIEVNSIDLKDSKNIRNVVGVYLLSQGDPIPKDINPRLSSWINFPTFSQNIVTLQKSQNIYYKSLFRNSGKQDFDSFNPIQSQPSDLQDPSLYLSSTKTKIKIILKFRSLDIIKRVEYAETEILAYISALGGFFGILKIILLLSDLFEYLYDSIRTICVGKSMKQLHSKIDKVVENVYGDYEMIQSNVELKDSSTSIPPNVENNQQFLDVPKEKNMEINIQETELIDRNHSGTSEEGNEDMVEELTERNSPELGIEDPITPEQHTGIAEVENI
jgi:hypothetical protein